MNKKSIILTLGCLTLLSTAALANENHRDREAAIARERAEVSMQEVIDKIATESKGRVVEIHFDEMDSFFSFEDGPLIYEVEALTEEGLMEYRVSPTDGSILSRSKEYLGGFEYRKLPKKMAFNLKQAVAKVEREGHGKVVSAELENEDGMFLYQIRTDGSGAHRTLLVDPMNGNLYPVSSHQDGDDD